MSGLIRIAVRARGDEAEPVRARLLELAPAGLRGAGRRRRGRARGLPRREAADAVLAELPGATFQPVEDGWEDAWRAFHQPVLVAVSGSARPGSVRRIRRVPS